MYFQLKKIGYNIYAINPELEIIEGDPVYSDLTMLPEKPDVVSIVIPRNGICLQDKLAVRSKYQNGAGDGNRTHIASLEG